MMIFREGFLHCKPAVSLFLLFWLSTIAEAGMIQGIALENLTGRPLARTRVTLFRLDGDRLIPVSTVPASRQGQFMFGPLQEGYYQISGTRAGFAEGKSGQRRDSGPGAPIFVTRDGSQFVELRLKRLGAITGRTLDENGVGLPGVPISAYTQTVPMRIAASATSDDLGMYRITGLFSGRYLVRTGPTQLEESFNLLPTYHPFASALLRDARPVFVELDGEAKDTDIQPVAGNLTSLAVKVTGCIGSAQVTLSSDTGRKQVTAACNLDPVVFNALSPGEYEVLAEGEADHQRLAAFTSMQLEGYRRAIGLPMRPLIDLRIRLADGTGPAIQGAGVIARRRDPAGEAPAVALTSDRVSLPPGLWQITARPPSGYYLSDVKIDSGSYRRTRRDPNPDWFEFPLESSAAQATISLSTRQAQVSGYVNMGGRAAIAAPVYLLATTPLTRQRMNGQRIAYTDVNGNYHFDSLAPGSYLILSSFDAIEINEDTMTAGRAQTVTLEEGRSIALDLALSQLP